MVLYDDYALKTINYLKFTFSTSQRKGITLSYKLIYALII